MNDNEGDKPAEQDDIPPLESDLDIHSAAVVDENGNEIPITPEMIERACDELDPEADDDAGD